MEGSYELPRLDALVGRFLSIQDITVGRPEKDYIVRYRGRLRSEDSAAAYDQLSAQLAPFNITPLFRWDGDLHAVVLVPAQPAPKPSNPRVNLVMFLLTLVSVSIAGVFNAGVELPANFGQAILTIFREGWPFTVAMLAILGTHEFGHYLMCRHHGVHATLPYFVPFLPPFGTMGAVIVMKERPKNRNQLLDVGIAGPFSGLVVAIPVLILGLLLSPVQTQPLQPPPGAGMEGNSLLYLFLKFVVFGKLLPAPASYGNLSPLLYWLRFFFTSRPFPAGGLDVFMHPVAFAGWGGLWVTALNLLPAGQLDGGHVVYVLAGLKNAMRLRPFILGATLLLGLVWPGWWLWTVLIYFLGRAYDDPLDQITPLDPRRRRLAILAIVIFILIFIPVPLIAF